jgi:hypothetical protein
VCFREGSQPFGRGHLAAQTRPSPPSELAPIGIDFAHQLLETVDAADRAALDGALIGLTERSVQLVPISPTDTVPAKLR